MECANGIDFHSKVKKKEKEEISFKIDIKERQDHFMKSCYLTRSKAC